MLQDGLDETLSLEVVDGTTSERTGDAELVADGGDGDGLLGRDLLEKLVIGLLVKEGGVVGLFLGLSLGPLLLLGFTTGCGSLCDLFLGLLLNGLSLLVFGVSRDRGRGREG